MRAWIAALLIAMVALSGCTSDKATEPTDSGTGTGECPDPEPAPVEPGSNSTTNETSNSTGSAVSFRQMQEGNETSNGTMADDGNHTVEEDAPCTEETPGGGMEGGNETNVAPIPVVGVDIKTAPTPADITFSFNASDADGDNLTWQLDVDGDGTPETEGNENNLPGTYTHTFETEGSYTALFTVDDGNNHTVTDNVTFTLQTPVPESDPFVFEAYFQEPCVQCAQGANTGVGYRSQTQGVDHVWVELPAGYAGKAYFAKTTGKIVGLSFRDACDGGGNVETPVTEAATLSGMVPAGATCVLMWEQDTVRGGKLSFIADGDDSQFPEDPLCYTSDFTLVGANQLGGLYHTDATWVYQEGNGVPGLQWEGEPSGPLNESHKPGCIGGDIVII